MRIVSIDFETANYSPVSACALGLAIFEANELVSAPYWLIKPPQGHDHFNAQWTRDIHGLSANHVRNAPGFQDIATEVVAHLVAADIVVAHNAAFDMRVLRALFQHFSRPTPTFNYLCTCRTARKVWSTLPNHRLSTLVTHIGHTFQHHHAGSDAEAAGRVLLAMTKPANTEELTSWLQALKITTRSF